MKRLIIHDYCTRAVILILLFVGWLSNQLVGQGMYDTVSIKAELRKLDKADMAWEQKEQAARELLAQSHRLGYVEGSLHASFVLATSYFFRQHYQRSYQVLDSMLLLLNSGVKNMPAGKLLEDKKSRIFSFMGTIFDEIGDYDKAMEYYLLSLQTVEQSGDDFVKAVLYKNLGMTNLAVGNVKVADDYFTRALNICHLTGDKKTVFDIYNALQGYYVDSAEYGTALQYGLQLLGIAKKDADPYTMALANKALGNIYLAWGKGMLAEGFLLEAFQLSEENQYETIMAEVLTGLAILRISEMRLKDALQLSQEAMEIADRTGIPGLKTHAAATSAKVFEEMNDYRNALKYFQLYESLKDVENREKDARSVLEMQARFEMDRVYREKTDLEDQLLIKQYQVSRRNYFLAATVIILALLLAFLISVIRRYKHVQKLNRQLREQRAIIDEQELRLHEEREKTLNLEIEHKNRELTSIAMALAQENEFKQHLIEQLEMLKLSLGPARKLELRQVNAIIGSIKQNISNNAWEEFRTYFDNVYSTFYSNLNEKYPFLSQSEKKLCAMLKLGLNTKEISMLTFREIKSVESARNRLRKKMNLDPRTNLVQYLANF